MLSLYTVTHALATFFDQLTGRTPGANNSVNVWLYQFGYNSTVPGDSVNHGGDLDFIWDRNTGLISHAASSVTSAMGELWANFVVTGKPTFHQPERHKEWPAVWPQFEERLNEQFMNISGDAKSAGGQMDDADAGMSGLYGDACDAWERYMEQGAQQVSNFNNFGYLC